GFSPATRRLWKKTSRSRLDCNASWLCWQADLSDASVQRDGEAVESHVLNTCFYLSSSGSSGSRGSENALSSLFSTPSSGANPTLSANLSFCVFNELDGVWGSRRAIRLDFAVANTLSVVETDSVKGHVGGCGTLTRRARARRATVKEPCLEIDSGRAC